MSAILSWPQCTDVSEKRTNVCNVYKAPICDVTFLNVTIVSFVALEILCMVADDYLLFYIGMSWKNISLAMIERIYILCLIIIIKSEVWTITHCLGLGHETMVSTVCLSIFLSHVMSWHYIYTFWGIILFNKNSSRYTLPIKEWKIEMKNDINYQEIARQQKQQRDTSKHNTERNLKRVSWFAQMTTIGFRSGSETQSYLQWQLIKPLGRLNIRFCLCCCLGNQSRQISISAETFSCSSWNNMTACENADVAKSATPGASFKTIRSISLSF